MIMQIRIMIKNKSLHLKVNFKTCLRNLRVDKAQENGILSGNNPSFERKQRLLGQSLLGFCVIPHQCSSTWWRIWGIWIGQYIYAGIKWEYILSKISNEMYINSFPFSMPIDCPWWWIWNGGLYLFLGPLWMLL